MDKDRKTEPGKCGQDDVFSAKQNLEQVPEVSAALTAEQDKEKFLTLVPDTAMTAAGEHSPHPGKQNIRFFRCDEI